MCSEPIRFNKAKGKDYILPKIWSFLYIGRGDNIAHNKQKIVTECTMTDLE